MSYQNKMNGMMGDYLNARQIPMLLSGAFLIASAYQFGFFGNDIILAWFGNYTLTADHSIMVSLGAWVFAFASSETKELQYYEDWEKVAIALGPTVILGEYLFTGMTDFLLSLGDPLGMQLAFLAATVSWGVAVR